MKQTLWTKDSVEERTWKCMYVYVKSDIYNSYSVSAMDKHNNIKFIRLRQRFSVAILAIMRCYIDVHACSQNCFFSSTIVPQRRWRCCPQRLPHMNFLYTCMRVTPRDSRIETGQLINRSAYLPPSNVHDVIAKIVLIEGNYQHAHNVVLRTLVTICSVQS